MQHRDVQIEGLTGTIDSLNKEKQQSKLVMGVLRKNLDSVENQLSKKKSLNNQIHDVLNNRSATIKSQEELLKAAEERQAGTAAKIQGYNTLISRHE